MERPTHGARKSRVKSPEKPDRNHHGGDRNRSGRDMQPFVRHPYANQRRRGAPFLKIKKIQNPSEYDDEEGYGGGGAVQPFDPLGYDPTHPRAYIDAQLQEHEAAMHARSRLESDGGSGVEGWGNGEDALAHRGDGAPEGGRWGENRDRVNSESSDARALREEDEKMQRLFDYFRCEWFGCWRFGIGRWALGVGRWALGVGRWRLG